MVLSRVEKNMKIISKCTHGLRIPNEGINQRNLKIWADVADKICLGCWAVPKNLGVGVDFRPCSEGDFLTECLKFVVWTLKRKTILPVLMIIYFLHCQN